MKKKILIIGAMVMVALVSTMLVRNAKPAQKTFAVVLTLSHPALESVQTGFAKVIATQYGQDIAITHYNAEGNLQQANLIAQKIASDKNVVGILAVGTLAAQTVAKAEKTRPIIIAAVSDPRVLGETSPNLCGLSDSISPSQQIDTILKLTPSIKRIALLYTPSEANSASMVEGLARELDGRMLIKTLVGVHEPQQIMTASQAACQNADAIVIPLDNQLVASMPSVIKATRDLGCLVITSNESPIHQGASIAFGVDYQKSGEDAGRLMTEIIAGTTDTKTVGFINPKKLDLFVNDRVLKEKGVIIDSSLNDGIIHIEGDSRG